MKNRLRNSGIAIIGDLDKAHKIARGGQISKTRGIFHALVERFGFKAIKMVDLTEHKKHPIASFFKVVSACLRYRVIVVILSSYGVSVVMPIVAFIKMFRKNTVVYSVIGGSLAEHCRGNSLMRKSVKKTDKIYVETKDMIPALKAIGIKNTEYAPTFSLKKPLKKPDFSPLTTEPYKLVTFSRITREKGIGRAIEAILRLNKSAGYTKYVLDICGVMDAEYELEFRQMIAGAKGGAINIIGTLDDHEVIPVLSKHAALLFPTSHSGEGFPASLVESMMAGLPILASDFAHNSSIIKEGYNGYLYDPKDGVGGLARIIERYFEDLEHAKQMKINCIEQSKKYTPAMVFEPMIRFIDARLKE